MAKGKQNTKGDGDDKPPVENPEADKPKLSASDRKLLAEAELLAAEEAAALKREFGENPIPMERMPKPVEELVKAMKAAREMPLQGLHAYDYRYGVRCVFVAKDGEEYDARMLPLPVNKGTLLEIPLILDPAKAYAELGRMPAAQRVKAHKELTENLSKTAPALDIKGETKRLVEYRGMLLHGLQINGKWVPAAHLMVNFSRKGGQEWKSKHFVRPKEFVPHGMASGIVPHFYLKD
ncbi:MAG: hypothetical protein M5U26_08390 [Planctomycetota bacterium]|nr:hypothetical protein [Planctomycetota bacterium]